MDEQQVIKCLQQLDPTTMELIALLRHGSKRVWHKLTTDEVFREAYFEWVKLVINLINKASEFTNDLNDMVNDET